MNSSAAHAIVIRVAGILILTALAAWGCSPSGPMEKEYRAIRAEYKKLAAAAGDADRKQRRALLDRIGPLLNEKNYKHSRDFSRQQQIIYQSSLLGAGLAFSMGVPLEARGYYMNAYLLNSAAALGDIKGLLPPESDLSVFKEVYIPEYKINAPRSTITVKSPEKEKKPAVGGKKEQTRRSRLVRVRADIKSAQAPYLLQMLCGDLLHKMEQKYPDMYRLEVSIQLAGRRHARCNWDFEADHIMLSYP